MKPLVFLFVAFLAGGIVTASEQSQIMTTLPRAAEFRFPGRRAMAVAGLAAAVLVAAALLLVGIPAPLLLGQTAQVVRKGTMRADAQARMDAQLGLTQGVGRDASLLTDEEWELVSSELVEVVRERAVFNEILQQFGITREQNSPGKTGATFWTIQDRDGGRTLLLHGAPAGDVPMLSDTTIPIVTHYADVHVPFEVLEASREGNLEARDALGIREAGAIVADLSNKFLAKGDSALGIDGVLNHTSRQTAAGTDWTTAGNAYNDVLDMRKAFEDKNIDPDAVPTVLFVNPAQKKEASFVFSSTGRPQSEAIAELLGGMDRIKGTNRLSAGTVAMLAMSRSYFQHLVTAPFQVTELGKLGMGALFRVWKKETVFVGVANAIVERTGT